MGRATSDLYPVVSGMGIRIRTCPFRAAGFTGVPRPAAEPRRVHDGPLRVPPTRRPHPFQRMSVHVLINTSTTTPSSA